MFILRCMIGSLSISRLGAFDPTPPTAQDQMGAPGESRIIAASVARKIGKTVQFLPQWKSACSACSPVSTKKAEIGVKLPRLESQSRGHSARKCRYGLD